MSGGAANSTVARLEGEILRATGRRYRIRFEFLDEESAREFLRLLRDLEDDASNRAKRAARNPWRRL